MDGDEQQNLENGMQHFPLSLSFHPPLIDLCGAHGALTLTLTAVFVISC